MSIESLGIKKVYIEVTNYCNFKCSFCPLGISKRPRRHMDFAVFEKAIDDIAGSHIAESVAFQILGEPLMYPFIVDAVGYASSRGLRTSITTNGSMLSKARVGQLVSSGLSRLTISLQRFGPDDHESRRAPMAFDDYYQGLLDAAGYVNSCDGRTELYVLMMNTVTRRLFDAGQLDDLTWDRRRFDESLITIIRDFCDASGGDRPTDAQLASAVHSLGTLQAALFRLNGRSYVTVRPFFDWGNAFNDGRLIPSKLGYCGLAFKSLGILNDGRVTLCCGDYDGGTALGNVAEQPLAEILLSERTQSIARAMNRLRLINPRCQACFGSSNHLKTALKALVVSGMFLVIKPGPGKQVKVIDPLAF